MNDIKSYCFPNSSESGNAPRTEIWVWEKKKKNSGQELKNESDDIDNGNDNSIRTIEDKEFYNRIPVVNID